MAKVSIIVPVYNAQDTIRRCVDSILGQDFTDFELILGDDGSRDASGEICDSYAQADDRVRVIHKENTGVSDTRNRCLEQARGDYIQFLDSDDWIVPEATKLFVRGMEHEGCDMVIASFYRVIGKRVSIKGDIQKEGILSREDFADEMMDNPADFYYGVLWNKFFRREIIEKYHLRMDPKVSWCEDFLFNLEYLIHCRNIYVLQAPVYYYVKTKGSLASQSLNPLKTIRMKMFVFDYYKDFFHQVYNEEDYEKKRTGIYGFLIAAAGDGGAVLGSTRLGEEHVPVYDGALSADGWMMDQYRERKLMERYLDTAALRFDLELRDMLVMSCLQEVGSFSSRHELSDYTQLTPSAVGRSLQKLVSRELVNLTTEKSGSRSILKFLQSDPDESDAIEESEDTDGEKSSGQKRSVTIRAEFTDKAAPVLDVLKQVRNDFDNAEFEGMTDEEKRSYIRTGGEVEENLKKTLKA